MTKINNIAKMVWSAVENCNESQLRNLIKECSGLTETNCWWLDWELKDIVSNLAIDQLSFRNKKCAHRKKA